MLNRFGRNGPKFLLCIVAALLACVVQSGELGSADTMHRLQTAHSFWTSEPAVFPNEYPEFGVHGRGGKLYDWYGIGQPLLMLPFDVAGSYLENLSIFENYENDPTIRNIFVTYAVNILLAVLTALVALRFLQLLGFNISQSVGGVLALLFCTTHLHYMQNMMENNYICLLTLTGFCFQYEWLRTGSRRALLIGSGVFGLNLLTRLTTMLDLIVGAAFLLLVFWFERKQGSTVQQRSTGQALAPTPKRALVDYVKTAFPVYLLFLFFDRLYQFYRFGNWTTTYVHYFTIEHRLQNPALPAKYPWETPFHVGFLGPLISIDKSIFLFDPLIVLTIILAVIGWKRFRADVKAYVTASLLLVLGYICLYARYTVWSGDFAWGDRYVSTAVQLAAFISVPILLRYRAEMGTLAWRAGVAIIAISFMVQLASIAFWMSLEIYQADDFGHPQFVIWLRMKNIVAFALGKMDAWGLNTDSMTYDKWDYQHVTTWNFLPFVLRRMGSAPRWVVDVTLAAWAATIAMLIGAVVKLRRALL